MKNAEREAQRWIDQAIDDYRFVKWVFREGQFFDKGCFIAQQAGEKALKACLYATGQRRVFGHSLFEMASKLIPLQDEFNAIVDGCKRLDRHYIPTRYPNGLPGGSPFQVYAKADLMGALKDLESVIGVAKRFIASTLQSKLNG